MYYLLYLIFYTRIFYTQYITNLAYLARFSAQQRPSHHQHRLDGAQTPVIVPAIEGASAWTNKYKYLKPQRGLSKEDKEAKKARTQFACKRKHTKRRPSAATSLLKSSRFSPHPDGEGKSSRSCSKQSLCLL
eukprot:1157319-Pelagomonas_calceolata.AAC.1